MEDFIAKCGCNCATCPTYKENLTTIDDRARCSSGWEKYLNIKLKPEKLKSCDGCSIPEEDRKVYYLNCRVRKCAMFNGIKNCAYCSAYPCQDLETIHSIQEPGAREKIEDRIGYQIPQNDYLAIIEPYEGIKHLNEIRKSLRTEDIIRMVPVNKIPKTIPFPKEIPLNNDLKQAYEKLHSILSSLEVAENVSYARSVELEKNRKQVLKLLWTFGLYGELEKAGEDIILGSERYSAEKNTSYYSKIQEYILVLENYGLNCEIVPVDDKNWKTPSGALRNKGWYLKLYSKENIIRKLLNALKNYAGALDEKYGKNAFRYFSKVDMRILC